MNPIIKRLTLRVIPSLIEKSLDFYELLGFKFKTVTVGREPSHYVSEENYTFEIYPLTRNDGYPQPHARLSFYVQGDILDKVENYRDSKGKGFLFQKTNYGALTKDPMGRSIELHLL